MQLKILQMSSCFFCHPCHPLHHLSQVLSPVLGALDPVVAQRELCSMAGIAAHWESTCYARHNDASGLYSKFCVGYFVNNRPN